MSEKPFAALTAISRRDWRARAPPRTRRRGSSSPAAWPGGGGAAREAEQAGDGLITAGWFPPSLRRKCVSETGGRAPASAALAWAARHRPTNCCPAVRVVLEPVNSGSRSRSARHRQPGASKLPQRRPGRTGRARPVAARELDALARTLVAVAAAVAPRPRPRRSRRAHRRRELPSAEGRDGLVALGAGVVERAHAHGAQGVGVGSGIVRLDWACAWRAGKAEVRTRTVASASAGRRFPRVSTTRTECGSGRTSVPRPGRGCRGSSLSLGVRRLAVFVFERVVHVRGGERRRVVEARLRGVFDPGLFLNIPLGAQWHNF